MLIYCPSSSFASKSFEISFPRYEYLNNSPQKEVSQPCLNSKLLFTQNGQKQVAFHTPKTNLHENLHEFQNYSFEESEIKSYRSSQSAYVVNTLKTQPQFFSEIMVSEEEQVSSKFANSLVKSTILPNTVVRNAVRVEFDKVPMYKSSYNSESEGKSVTVIIKEAVYGFVDNPNKQVYITEQVQELVSQGMYDITANNKFAGKDPAKGYKKALKIYYAVNDKLVILVIPERSTMNLLKDRPIDKE